MHSGTLALSTNDLRLQGVAACALSIIIMTILPLVEYYLVGQGNYLSFSLDKNCWVVRKGMVCFVRWPSTARSASLLSGLNTSARCVTCSMLSVHMAWHVHCTDTVLLVYC